MMKKKAFDVQFLKLYKQPFLFFSYSHSYSSFNDFLRTYQPLYSYIPSDTLGQYTEWTGGKPRSCKDEERSHCWNYYCGQRTYQP